MMRLFQTFYKALLLLALAALGYLIYLFATPVTQGNMQARVASVCAVGNMALHINRNYILTDIGLNDADCACASHTLVEMHGNTEGARLMNIARQLFLNSVRANLTRSTPSFDGVDRSDIQKLQQFFETVFNKCAVKT